MNHKPAVQQSPPSADQLVAVPPKKKTSKRMLWGMIGGVVGLVALIFIVTTLLAAVGKSNSQAYTDAYKEAEQLAEAYEEFDSVQTSQIFAKIQGGKLTEENTKVYRDSAALFAKHDKTLLELTEDLPDPAVKKARETYLKERQKKFGDDEDAVKLAVEEDILSTNLSATCVMPFKNELIFLHRDGSHQRIIKLFEDCEAILDDYDKNNIDTDKSKGASDQLRKSFAKIKAIAKQKGSQTDFEKGLERLSAAAETTEDDTTEAPKPGGDEEFSYFSSILAFRNALADKADPTQIYQGKAPGINVPGIEL